MILWKRCTQYVSKFGKLSSGHRIGKGQFSSQSQKEAMPKNEQTTVQLHSHASKVKLKILQARLQQNMNQELPDVQAGFRTGRGTRDQIAKEWSQEKKGITEDEMVGWHHWLNGNEFEQAPGVGDGQGSLVCWCPRGHNWGTELNCSLDGEPGPCSKSTLLSFLAVFPWFASPFFPK